MDSEATKLEYLADLLDYLQSIKPKRASFCGLQIYLSRLRPYNRQRHQLNNAYIQFQNLISYLDPGKNNRVFYTQSGDIIYVSENKDPLFYEKLMIRFKKFFADDPLLEKDARKAESFFRVYQLGSEYESFKANVEEIQNETLRLEKKVHVLHLDTVGIKYETPINDIKLDQLVELEQILSQADISNYLRRQQIYLKDGDRGYFPICPEYYISIQDLEDNLTPGFSLHANIWLFKHLCMLLDKRLLVKVLEISNQSASLHFHINLSLRTLLGRNFHEFDQKMDLTKHQITIEIDQIDLLSDFNAYLFLREHLIQKGYQICVDGVTKHTLDFFMKRSEYFHKIKLFWSDDLVMGHGECAHMSKEFSQIGLSKFILARCDSPSALEVGSEIGINQFQGFFMDRVATQPELHADKPVKIIN